MPKYRITDPATGKTMTVSGDAPPSQEDAAAIFAALPKVNLTGTPILSRPPPPERPTQMDTLKGAGEAALSLGTNFAATLGTGWAGGLAAGADMALRQAAGVQEPSPTREIIDRYTLDGYTPKTSEGQRILDLVVDPIKWLDDKFVGAGNAVVDTVQPKVAAANQERTEAQGNDLPTGISAIPATAVRMAPDALMTLFGLVKPSSSAVRGVERSAERLGLDLQAPTETQLTQLQTAANNRFSPSNPPALDMDTVPDAIRQRREQEAGRVGGMFTEAQDMGAELPSRSAGTLGERLNQVTSRFIRDDMTSVNTLLKEAEAFGDPARQSLSEVMGVRNSAKVPINDLFAFREKINANLPSDVNSPEHLALSRMRREFDSYLEERLTNDLVSGNPAAIPKWREAIAEWKDFRTTFDDNRVIAKLQNEQATAEQVKNLILGMNAVRANAQSGLIVQGLKKILGPDSPEFKTIQQSALADIMMPLVDIEPSFSKFVTNYDTFIRRNSSGETSLANQLFDEATLKELDELRNFASGIDKAAPFDIQLRQRGWERAAAVFAIGKSGANSMARNALKINLLSRVFRALKPDTGIGRKNTIINEVLGYDPRQNLFRRAIPNGPIANEAALDTFRDDTGTINDFTTRQRPQ
jgi:hypothetical protein